MSKENEKRNNAHRLVYALYSLAYDAASIKRLASVLHYDAAQLQTDMRDLESYVSGMESGENEQ